MKKNYNYSLIYTNKDGEEKEIKKNLSLSQVEYYKRIYKNNFNYEIVGISANS